MDAFFQSLANTLLPSEGTDSLCWTAHKSGKFSVKSFYKHLLGRLQSPFRSALHLEVSRIIPLVRNLGGHFDRRKYEKKRSDFGESLLYVFEE